MSKGPRILPTVRKVIFGEALKDRNKPRRQVMVELQNIIESMGEIVPAEDTLERLISSARSHPTSPLDEPFSLGSLAKYDIPPETLPMVLRVWKICLKYAEKGYLDFPFTIRYALWVSRLSKLSEDPDEIWGYAYWYSWGEQVHEILGATTYTTDDTAILKIVMGTEEEITDALREADAKIDEVSRKLGLDE